MLQNRFLDEKRGMQWDSQIHTLAALAYETCWNQQECEETGQNLWASSQENLSSEFATR